MYLPVLLTLTFLLWAAPVRAQVTDQPGTPPVTRADAPRVYIDCSRCDSQHIRTTVTFVNHVRDPAVADVYVLITDQPTGSGGRLYTLAFSGRSRFAEQRVTVTHAALQSDTWSQERDGVARALTTGLAPFVAQTSLASALTVRFDPPEVDADIPELDPWRGWTFEVYGGGNLSTEVSQTAWNARYGFYANRVTDEWKVRARPYFNNNQRTIRREGRDDILLRQRRHGFEGFVIKSLGDHWGAGIFTDYLTTTVDNLDHRVRAAPALEYSYFPYAEASSRAATLTYRIGYEYADYIQETIFEKTREALSGHELEASVRIRQAWGSVSASVEGFNYFHDTSLHRVSMDASLSLRLGRGFSVNLGGGYERINDQISLPRGDASLEDILLERRRLATSYRGSGSVGLSYTFGSIFTNVVNPRF